MLEVQADFTHYMSSPGQTAFIQKTAGWAHHWYESWATDVQFRDIDELMDDASITHAQADGDGAGFFQFGHLHSAAHIQISAGNAYVYIASNLLQDAIDQTLRYLKAHLPESAPPNDSVSITFWSNSSNGPVEKRRVIQVPEWDDIADNYTADVKARLERLMDKQDGDWLRAGQLLLWHGPPGTGKTYALRALARQWKSWARFHYIVDPDQFFGQHTNYMMSVLLGGGDDWRVLVLEDAGELLAADARVRQGQAVSRLLNTVDGLIGQGLKILVLVTTNEELRKLDPAVSRPGRTASLIKFEPLTPDEVAQWYRSQGVEATPAATPLAQLYASVDEEFEKAQPERKVGF